VFFDSLAGKAFLARSIKLCLIDNQRSSGVTVAGIRIVSDLKPDRQRRDLHKSNLPVTSRKIGHVSHQLVSKLLGLPRGIFSFALDSYLFIT
jgi:hypothetical protein